MPLRSTAMSRPRSADWSLSSTWAAVEMRWSVGGNVTAWHPHQHAASCKNSCSSGRRSHICNHQYSNVAIAAAAAGPPARSAGGTMLRSTYCGRPSSAPGVWTGRADKGMWALKTGSINSKQVLDHPGYAHLALPPIPACAKYTQPIPCSPSPARARAASLGTLAISRPMLSMR